MFGGIIPYPPRLVKRSLSFLAEIRKAEGGRGLGFALSAQTHRHEHDDRHDVGQHLIETGRAPDVDADHVRKVVVEPVEHTGFAIPKLSTDGLQEGLVDIPIISAEEAAVSAAGTVAAAAIKRAAEEVKEDTSSWQPPTLDDNKSAEEIDEADDVDFKEASQMIADVNTLLQKEIDRLTVEEVSPVQEDYIEEPVIESISVDEGNDYRELMETPTEEQYIQEADETAVYEYEDDFELPPIEIPQDILDELTEDAVNDDIYYGAQDLQTTMDGWLASVEPYNGKILDSTISGGYGELTVLSGSGPMLIKVEDSYDSSRYISFYVRADSEAMINVPDGDYYVKYFTGDVWYGMGSLFGRNTSGYIADDIMSFETTYSGNYVEYSTITLTLYSVAGGNLTSSPLDVDDY